VKTCTHDAIVLEDNVAYIDYGKCRLCRECEAMCPTGAIHGVNFPKELDKDAVKARIAERQKKAREAAAAAEPVAVKPAAEPLKKEENNG
jgi:Fe-S-cluster-containing hydrogenase component 2